MATGGPVVLALEVACFCILTAACALLLSLHDARQQGWHTDVGYTPLRGLMAFDVAVACLTFLGLTLASGYGWHALAKRGVLEPRSNFNNLWSLLLCAITASLAGLAALGFRLPRGQRRVVLKRLMALRTEQLTHIRSMTARHQTIDHCDNVLPGLKRANERGILAQRVRAWAPAAGVGEEQTERLVQLALLGDDDSLLTLAADICNKYHGRGFLDDLIERPKSGRRAS